MCAHGREGTEPPLALGRHGADAPLDAPVRAGEGSALCSMEARAIAAEKTVAVLKGRLVALDDGIERCPIRAQLAALERRTRASAWRSSAAAAARKSEAHKQAERAMYEEFMENLEREVSARTEDIRSILDNVGSGLLLVGRDRLIAAGWSKSCIELLVVADPTGKRLSEVLGLAPREAENLEAGLEQILDDVLPEELTVAQACSRVTLGERTLGLTYGAVRREGVVDAVLVTITDVTAQIVAERAARHARALLAIRTHFPLFRMFVEDARRLLDEAREAAGRNDVATLRRAVHTLKGNASVHDLDEVVQVVHAAESRAEISVDEVHGIEAALDGYLRDNEAVLGPVDDDEAEVAERPLSDADVRLIVVSSGGNPALIEHLLAQRRYVPAARLTTALEAAALRVASRLEKSVEVVVSGGHVALDARRLAGVLGGLTHLVRNAVDHGLEPREERGTKPPTGTLTLRFEDLPDAWRISVCDDGRGIDPRRVAEAAAAKGLDVHPTSVEEAFDVLCMPGFSTADQVSDISGRGVGLSAVKEAVLELGGRVVVRSVPGVGTEFELSCPKAA